MCATRSPPAGAPVLARANARVRLPRPRVESPRSGSTHAQGRPQAPSRRAVAAQRAVKRQGTCHANTRFTTFNRYQDHSPVYTQPLPQSPPWSPAHNRRPLSRSRPAATATPLAPVSTSAFSSSSPPCDCCTLASGWSAGTKYVGGPASTPYAGAGSSSTRFSAPQNEGHRRQPPLHSAARPPPLIADSLLRFVGALSS